jgi:hypothetical protein
VSCSELPLEPKPKKIKPEGLDITYQVIGYTSNTIEVAIYNNSDYTICDYWYYVKLSNNNAICQPNFEIESYSSMTNSCPLFESNMVITGLDYKVWEK